jgi:hypothetical protein
VEPLGHPKRPIQKPKIPSSYASKIFLETTLTAVQNRLAEWAVGDNDLLEFLEVVESRALAILNEHCLNLPYRVSELSPDP